MASNAGMPNNIGESPRFPNHPMRPFNHPGGGYGHGGGGSPMVRPSNYPAGPPGPSPMGGPNRMPSGPMGNRGPMPGQMGFPASPAPKGKNSGKEKEKGGGKSKGRNTSNVPGHLVDRSSAPAGSAGGPFDAGQGADNGSRMVPGQPRPGMQHMPPMHPHMGPMHDSKGAKRPHPGASQQGGPGGANRNKKKRKIADKILPKKVRDLVPGSDAYLDLLAFERKLDEMVTRKRLEFQEALKRPMKLKKKLRIFISNSCIPSKVEEDGTETSAAAWELKVEGRLIEEVKMVEVGKPKRKFSSYFKSLVIELDKELYGPDNHLVEWQRMAKTQETDGFQVTRSGEQNVKCTILLMLDNKPPKHKLDQRLARLLGIHSESRPAIMNALWNYIKTQRLQDGVEREYIKCDKYLAQIFGSARMKFAEVPQRLNPLLLAPDPIVINHTIVAEGPDAGKKTAAYDIEVEVDAELRGQVEGFLLSSQAQQEIGAMDSKICEILETINQLKTRHDFFHSFSQNPQEFISNWLVSQTKDLKTMTELVGNPEEERQSSYYNQPWADEAVYRYIYNKVQQKRMELERALALQNA